MTCGGILRRIVILSSLFIANHALQTFNKDDVSLEITTKLNRNVTIKEEFLTNVQKNSIIAQFQLADGLICLIVYDFLNDIKIFKLDVLGETELGEKQYESMCFVAKLNKNDIIPAEAMGKLRQKSSHSLQEPNEILSNEVIPNDVQLLNLGSTRIFGENFQRLCTGRYSVVHASHKELGMLVKGNTEMMDILRTNSFRPSSDRLLPPCAPAIVSTVKFQPCICKVPFTIAWYPCLVKYCQSKSALGNPVSTRCGIRSCRKTYELNFVVNNPLSCHWGVT